MKNSILSKLPKTKGTVPVRPLPDNLAANDKGPLLDQAVDMVKVVGGEVYFDTDEDPKRGIHKYFADLKVVYAPDHELDSMPLSSLEVLVLRGEFLVAENGAVWLNGDKFGKNRSLPFLAEHLVIMVNPQKVLANMHEAYKTIQSGTFGYGLFVSGPSKTADIEQALVMGAQGPRRMTLWLTEEI